MVAHQAQLNSDLPDNDLVGAHLLPWAMSDGVMLVSNMAD